jgi:hypothetical protein
MDWVQRRSNHLGRFTLYLVLHPQNCDVSFSCSRVKRDDYVPSQTLLEYLKLIVAGFNNLSRRR